MSRDKYRGNVEIEAYKRKNGLKPTLFRIVFIIRFVEMRFNNSDFI